MRHIVLASMLSCASVQTVTRSTLNCADPSLPALVTQALGALNGSNSTADLDKMLEADGVTLAVCAVQAAVTTLENGGSTGPVPFVMGKASAAPKPADNVPAIARGEAWLAVHSK
jgi:hypothetical protein